MSEAKQDSGQQAEQFLLNWRGGQNKRDTVRKRETERKGEETDGQEVWEKPDEYNWRKKRQSNVKSEKKN